MKYNFDNIVNRRNSNSYKWDVKENELPMWVADMDFEVLPEIKQAIENKAKINAYGYTQVPESYFKSYSLWWERRHNFKFDVEWMIFSTGVVATISSVVRKLTTVGENVLVQSPVYNIFYNSIINNGRNVVSNDLVYKNGEYSIDFEDLEMKLSNPQTTLMILCNPHNPVGRIWTRQELEKIGELCYKHNVIVLSDEIHCDFQERGKKYLPFVSINKINEKIGITCLSGSKIFNIAGLQSSVVAVSDPNLRHKVWRGINTDEVGEPNFFCIEANIAAFTYGDKWVDELNEYINDNKKIVYDYIKENVPDLQVIQSEATYLLWIDVSKYCAEAKQLCDFIREKTGLFVNSGEVYGVNGRSFIRLNVATNRKNVIEGCKRLHHGLEEFKKEFKNG